MSESSEMTHYLYVLKQHEKLADKFIEKEDIKDNLDEKKDVEIDGISMVEYYFDQLHYGAFYQYDAFSKMKVPYDVLHGGGDEIKPATLTHRILPTGESEYIETLDEDVEKIDVDKVLEFIESAADKDGIKAAVLEHQAAWMTKVSWSEQVKILEDIKVSSLTPSGFPG